MRIGTINHFGEKGISQLKPSNSNLGSENVGIQEKKAKVEIEVPEMRISLLSEEELEKVLERVKVSLKYSNIDAEYSVHERTNTIMVKLKDNFTNEIIREIPPEKILDMIAGLWELAGLIVDEKV